MTPDTDDLRSFAQRAGWKVLRRPWIKPDWTSTPLFWIIYTGPDPALRALQDHGPYDNEADAWARAIGLAQACVIR